MFDYIEILLPANGIICKSVDYQTPIEFADQLISDTPSPLVNPPSSSSTVRLPDQGCIEIDLSKCGHTRATRCHHNMYSQALRRSLDFADYPGRSIRLAAAWPGYEVSLGASNAWAWCYAVRSRAINSISTAMPWGSSATPTARRQHVHQRIADAELPVKHQTRRTGSPYTLVLTKTDELFEREALTRRQDAQDLKWLESHRGP